MELFKNQWPIILKERELGERIFNDGNLNDENFLKKNLLLPVPKDEIDTNSALDYSDNNYGYTN